MVQFKDIFAGDRPCPYPERAAVTAQVCFWELLPGVIATTTLRLSTFHHSLLPFLQLPLVPPRFLHSVDCGNFLCPCTSSAAPNILGSSLMKWDPLLWPLQLCVRAGGKHNDLENVGRTARHHTLFEMLGNFSFGAHSRQQVMELAWRFLTQQVQIPAGGGRPSSNPLPLRCLVLLPHHELYAPLTHGGGGTRIAAMHGWVG